MHAMSTTRDTQANIQLEVMSPHSVLPQLFTCKIDTGAEGNVIPLSLYKELVPQNAEQSLNVSSTIIMVYGGSTVPQLGTVKHQDASKNSHFHVVKNIGPAIMGLPMCRALGLITLNYSLNILDTQTAIGDGNPEERRQILEEYNDCFQGIGCFEGRILHHTGPHGTIGRTFVMDSHPRILASPGRRTRLPTCH